MGGRNTSSGTDSGNKKLSKGDKLRKAVSDANWEKSGAVHELHVKGVGNAYITRFTDIFGNFKGYTLTVQDTKGISIEWKQGLPSANKESTFQSLAKAQKEAKKILKSDIKG